MMQLALR